MNQDLRSEHIVRLISEAKRRLMLPPGRDDGLRRLHDWRERFAEHDHRTLVVRDGSGRSHSGTREL